MKKHKKITKGFTLVELVIVLVILAILVGIALPAFMGARAKAYRAEALGIMSEIKAMAWCYRLQYGNDTNSGWTPIKGGIDRFRAIGYGAADKPQSPNYNYTIWAVEFAGEFYSGATMPGQCGLEFGYCFLCQATPWADKAAKGSQKIYMVTNYTGYTTISYGP